MTSIIDLQGWQLLWACAGIGIIIAGLLVALGVFVDVAARIREEWRERGND